MDLKDFTQKIMDQFLEEDQPYVTSEIDFRTLDSWDSLTGMAVLSTIEDEYNVSIPVATFRQLNTINELFIFVQNQKSE